MKSIRIMFDMIFNPKRFLSNYNPRSICVRNILHFSFIIQLIIIFPLFALRGRFDKIVIPVVFTIMFGSVFIVYVMPAITALLLKLYDMYFAKKGLNFRKALIITLPLLLIDNLISLINLIVSVLRLESIFNSDTFISIYSVALHLYSILLTAFYLKELYSYNKRHLAKTICFFVIVYIII